jgi:hypothetical protein
MEGMEKGSSCISLSDVFSNIENKVAQAIKMPSLS